MAAKKKSTRKATKKKAKKKATRKVAKPVAKKKSVRKVSRKAPAKRVSKVSRSPGMRKAPMGVKLISLLAYISAVVLVIAGLALLFGQEALSSSVLGEALGSEVAGVAAGVALIVLGIIEYLIARGLWRLQSWARTVTIVFSALFFLDAILVLFSTPNLTGLVDLVLFGLIGSYLWFSKEAKAAFKK